MSVDAQYRAAREGAALLDDLRLGILAATGPDRQKFLQGMLSNDVLAHKPGEGCLAALLDVKGHVVALLRVLLTEKLVWLELPAGRVERVEVMLNHYRVAAPVRFQAEPLAAIGLVGPKAGDLLRAAGAELPADAPESHRESTIGGRPVRLSRDSELPGGGFMVHAQGDAAAAVRDALVGAGVVALDAATLDAVRVEAGRPWYGPDVTEANLLHETGLVPERCSFSKGCYIGQEVVARLDARGGNVNKRLRGLRLSAPSAALAEVAVAGKNVGQVTTAAVSPRLGPIAMAYVHRGHDEHGTTVEVGGEAATVVSLPFSA
jgi:tRNA-modifying protein YgfZ